MVRFGALIPVRAVQVMGMPETLNKNEVLQLATNNLARQLSDVRGDIPKNVAMMRKFAQIVPDYTPGQPVMDVYVRHANQDNLDAPYLVTGADVEKLKGHLGAALPAAWNAVWQTVERLGIRNDYFNQAMGSIVMDHIQQAENQAVAHLQSGSETVMGKPVEVLIDYDDGVGRIVDVSPFQEAN